MSVNDQTQKTFLTLEQIEAQRIIKAWFCSKVDEFNAPLLCKKCKDYMQNCKGRVREDNNLTSGRP